VVSVSESERKLPDTFQTARLALRPFSLADVAAVFAYSRDADWARYQSTPHPYSEAEAERFVAELILRDRASQPCWAITVQSEVIGILSLVFHAGHRIAVLGYGVRKDYWGKGLTGEAIQVVLDQAFRSHRELWKVRAHTDARNSSSIRVLRKLGFACEGTLRANQYAKGELVDEAIYGVLRPEWESRRRPDATR
jgi:ribosomal-protein-alanine N-acetyltransferase